MRVFFKILLPERSLKDKEYKREDEGLSEVTAFGKPLWRILPTLIEYFLRRWDLSKTVIFFLKKKKRKNKLLKVVNIQDICFEECENFGNIKLFCIVEQWFCGRSRHDGKFFCQKKNNLSVLKSFETQGVTLRDTRLTSNSKVLGKFLDII